MKKKKKKTIIKRLHDINSFHVEANEMVIIGKDEESNEFIFTMDCYEFLEWIDTGYIKDKLIDYLNELH